MHPSRLAHGIVFLGAFAFVSATAPLQAEPEHQPSALEIFDGALEKFETDRVALRQWQYRQTLTTQQFDGVGKVVAKGTWRSIVRPGDPGPLEYTSKKVEGKISFFEAGAEEPQPPPSAAKSGTPAAPTPPPKAAGKAIKSNKNQTEWAVETVKKYHLRDRYIWKRLPDGRAAGEEGYVLSFTPKPKQNASTREERFFGHLGGKMWISKRDFTVLRAQGALQSPAQLFWIIARVTTFKFNYHVEPVHGENRLLRSSRATAATTVAFPFYKVRQKHWHVVDKYEPRRPRGSSLAP